MKKLRKLTAFLASAAIALCSLTFPAHAEQTDPVDYSDSNNWAFWDYGDEEKPADLFIVCPCVDMGKSGNYNSDITDEKIKSRFVGALNMELGIYTDVAKVYSPYYRQATFPVYSLDESERAPYLQTAYDDVRSAFLYYCDNCDESRPLILAGFSEGSELLIRLMAELFGDAKYPSRLIAAYVPGWRLTEEQTKQYPWLVPAQVETDADVIVTFNSEAEHITSSLMVGENEHTFSINPLNWKTDSTPADKSLNKGACFIDYDGNITSEIPELTGAYIDEKRGTLKVTDVSEADYPGSIFDDGIFHIYDYQFFYRNLQENVAKRTAAFIDDDKIIIGAEDYSLYFEAEIDREECFVGETIGATISVRNDGDAELNNVAIYLNGESVQTFETLAVDKGWRIEQRLIACESDVESGGVINITVDVDELDETLKKTFVVKVKPVEENPATGTESFSFRLAILPASFVVIAVLSRGRRKARRS